MKRDVWRCPQCRAEYGDHQGRRCAQCGYTGDWIQPGETALHGAKCPPKRMWINQPSTLQPAHALHGEHVLAVHEYDDTYRVYFLHGAVESQQMLGVLLSPGWPHPQPTRPGTKEEPACNCHLDWFHREDCSADLAEEAKALSQARYLACFKGKHDDINLSCTHVVEWDCTDAVNQMCDSLPGGRGTFLRSDIEAATHGGGEWLGESARGLGVFEAAKNIKADPAAPCWVHNWSGPFTIAVRRQGG